jgi:hypothetical protein
MALLAPIDVTAEIVRCSLDAAMILRYILLNPQSISFNHETDGLHKA